MNNFVGLSSEEAKRRLKVYGRNEIVERKKTSALTIFLSQFKSPIILLMLAAFLVSLLFGHIKGGDYIDSILILGITILCVLAGFVQEYKAEKAIEALKKMSTPKARVIRDGKVVEIESVEIVPGDLILVEGGDVIPADAEILEGKIEVDESPLTGESKAVKKKKGDKIFLGCHVFVGKAVAQVYNTGMNTEIGKIAGKMQEMSEDETPFQKDLESFTKNIVRIILLLVLLTFIISFEKFGILDALLFSLALAVAAIPQSLPAVITAGLSFAARKMAKKNALVRRLSITESIGSIDVICTDKTGTLTEGKMKVRDIWLLEDRDFPKKLAVEVCFYCNDAKFVKVGEEEKMVGDETDIALKEFSSKFIEREEYKRIDEIHFTSERKMMSVLCEKNNGRIVFSKGAPEVILSKCAKVLIGEKIIELNDELKKRIMEKNNEFASQAFRVLALAYREGGELEERDLVFIGLVLLSDPPRKEVKEAIEECYSAGIRVIMITGDNEITAMAVAKEIGLKTEGFLKGEDLDRMSDEEISEALEKGINIFARTNPFHKLRILELLKKKEYIVAMTGDGVNDALALKKADVGIAMGIKGTEVAREASDIVLLDDNFATIRNAIREGRKIYDNMRKFIIFLFGCNIAEVFVILSSLLFLPFILLYPIQILWINLVTDGPPALALSFDPEEPNIMKRKPRKKGEGLVNKKIIGKILVLGFSLGLSIFISGILSNSNLDKMRTVVFTSFVIFEMIAIASIRYSEKMFGIKYWLDNKLLLISLAGVITLQFFLIYSPFGSYFKSIPLSLQDLDILVFTGGLCFVLSVIGMKAIERLFK